MGAFGPKLEPGERVVARVALLPLWQPVLMTVAGLALALSAAARLAAGSGLSFLEIVSLGAGAFALAAAVLIYGVSRRRTPLVTNRRLLWRRGRTHYEELLLAEVEAVTPYRLGDGLFVTGRGRKIIVPCTEKTAARIRTAIAAAKGAARMRATIEAAKATA